MNPTTFAFGDPRAQKAWAPDLFDQQLQTMRLYPLMGTDGRSIIHVNKDLTRGPGGEIVFESWNPLTDAGQGDGQYTLGNEDVLQARNMSLRVHARKKATMAGDLLDQQLTSLYGVEAFRTKSKDKLVEWGKEAYENDLCMAVCGLYNVNSSSNSISTINESYPASTRIVYLGQTVGATPQLDNSGVSYGTDALLTAATAANNLFGTLVLNKARSMAIMATPKFRPGRFTQTPAGQERSVQFPIQQGKLVGDFFVVLVSPYQMTALRSELGENAFAQCAKFALDRGNDNPIFTGGTILWNGMLVVEYERIPYRIGAGGATLAEGFLLNAGRTATTDVVASAHKVARGVLLGAQAACWGWAKLPGWWEEMYDANYPRVKTEMLYGIGRTRFNAPGGTTPGAEEAIICLDTEIYT